MFQTSFIKKNKKEFLLGLEKRNFDKVFLLDKILLLDEKRKKIQTSLNKILEKENIFSNRIGEILNSDSENKYEIEILKKRSFSLKKDKNILNDKLKKITKDLENNLDQIPNIPDDKVKKKSNDLIFLQDKICSTILEKPLPHWELSKKFKLFDLSLGTKICGSGFPVYMGRCAKLQRSLIQYFLDQNIKASYEEYVLPYLINENSGYATGQIPDKEDQMYFLEKENFYLIPTGEIPLMNCYRNKIFTYTDLPVKATTYTSCFRREAGSYGTKVRGLNRLHQFDKVEIVQITTSENSSHSLEEMISHVKNIIQSLNLPFRILCVSGEDLGFSSAITYDFEVYSIAQKKWLEVSSVSNCTNFQSNRLKIRYKNIHGEIKLCHTLNGSALALPRIIAVLLENNQTKTHINIPKVLISYTGFDKIK
ncbi:serine--tRNA ligase [Blattabacterium cuenoti]|uniref:serine--tRNA ligase n=1 Tax=Blattabacterium cuenoti TaxID=1653831 RepID=UPI00163D2F3B|nr:serine--tRNA ligase [Blattabacterium cuenoti]